MTKVYIRITDSQGSFVRDTEALHLSHIPRPGEHLTGEHGLLTVSELTYHLEDGQIHHVKMVCKPQEDTEHH